MAESKSSCFSGEDGGKERVGFLLYQGKGVNSFLDSADTQAASQPYLEEILGREVDYCRPGARDGPV